MWPQGSTLVDVAMQGTTLVSADDHSLNHRQIGSIINQLPTVFGTTPGTNILGAFVLGNFAMRVNNSNIPQAIVNGGTFNNIVAGTPAITGGTYNNGVMGTPAVTGGTYSNGVFGTPSIDLISARNAGTGIGFNHSIYPAEGTIVDSAGGTFTVDARASQIYYSVMGTAAGNRTLGTPSNLSPYQQLTYAFKASGSANGTLVFSSIYRFSQDIGTPVLGTGSTWNYYGFRYNSIDSKLDFMGQSKNII